MVWQDILLSLSNILFTYSIFWQVYYGFKNKKGYITLQSSSITTLGLLVMSFTFLSLGLYFAAIVSLINGTLWYTLLLQRVIYPKI